MAIKINLQETEQELFCCSKWWGDPDLPADMEYPLAKAEEDGEGFDYPLTFVCQIDCEDIAPFDPEGKLPHEGMFYIFAGLDEYLELDSPWHNMSETDAQWLLDNCVCRRVWHDRQAGTKGFYFINTQNRGLECSCRMSDSKEYECRQGKMRSWSASPDLFLKAIENQGRLP